MKLWTLAFAIAGLAACGSVSTDYGAAAPGQTWQEQVTAAEAVAVSLDDSGQPSKNMGLVDGISVGGGLVRVSLHLPTSQGTIASRLWLSAKCLLKHDRRLVALIPGTLANGAGYYEVDVPGREGFNAVRVLAKSGYCALAVDLPGTGESVHPADAMNLQVSDNAAAVAEVARPISLLLGIPKWDVYAETGAPSPVALLLSRRHDVRSLVASSAFYLRYGPASAQAFDPAFQAFAAVTPYLPIDPAILPFFFGPAYPDVLAAAVDALLGPPPQAIPTGVVFNEVAAVPATFDPVAGEFVLSSPIVNAAPARANALFLQGSPDFVGSEAGTAELAAEYGATGGGDAGVITIPGASHLMRFDAPLGDGSSGGFWSPILSFLAAN